MAEQALTFGVYATGVMTGLSLIVAIGAQNAFVLRQGLRGEHVLLVCLACALSDALLIALGVSSFAAIAALLPWLDPVMRYGGAVFLLWYALGHARAALRGGETLDPARGGAVPLRRTLLTCLALTWLNPHVYLDTVVLLGTLSTRFPGEEVAFALGAMTASFAFFFGLGYGARLLRPLFASPAAWRVLEAVIAATMTVIAVSLLRGG